MCFSMVGRSVILRQGPDHVFGSGPTGKGLLVGAVGISIRDKPDLLPSEGCSVFPIALYLLWRRSRAMRP